jgi:DNA mismatch repair protein MutS
MEQYRRIRRDHQGEILFFRLGDFYEMFDDDALEVSRLLNLTLTSRAGQPMCGVPHNSARIYIARLLKYGKKIAVCEQVSESGKGLIERKVVEVVTPGTTVDEDYLDKGSSNYLACLASDMSGAREFSFAYIELSTGEFYASVFPAERAPERLKQELERLQPREIILQESLLEENQNLAAVLDGKSSLVINRWADWLFDPARSRERLEKQFGQHSLKGFGLKGIEAIAAGALLDYLDNTAGRLIPHIRSISVYTGKEFTGMDEATQKNLELIRNLQDGESRFTLLEVMDQTRTSMGKRLLKTRILQPLMDVEKIDARLNLLETLYRNQETGSRLREILGKSPDLERMCSRIAMDKAHGKDMASVRSALAAFELLEAAVRDFALVFESAEAVSAGSPASKEKLSGLKKALDTGLAEEPSTLLTEGNLIRHGYNTELDRLKDLRDSGRKTLEDYLEEEREATGIQSLKIRYNRIIGYFFEVNNLHLSKVPSHFIRRQGLAGAERFSTERLAGMESEINGASERIIELEKRIFLEIREKAKAVLPELFAAGRRIAELDTAQSLARAAAVHGWARPVVDYENRLHITEGRHPVVEAHLSRGGFIPNDVMLDSRGGSGVSFALITGPNMAGKSTYLRQAALAAIMAQCGSFVPAAEARIGVCDRIFCRVGATDSLARGESTFLVEMNETAAILHTATEKSLVIMDEVGRGTGAADGLAIAWAVSEDLLNRLKCRALFATHYHELAGIRHPAMANRSMDVKETKNEIVFLRRLREGPADRSYGLHVAMMAGLPEAVLLRAYELLEGIEKRGAGPEIKPCGPPETAEAGAKARSVLSELSKLETDKLPPIEALKLIAAWKKHLAPAAAPTQTKRESAAKGYAGPGLFD